MDGSSGVITQDFHAPEGGQRSVYTRDGNEIVACGFANVFVYSRDGKMLHRIKGQSNMVHMFCLVPGSDDYLTVGLDGSYLFTIPKTIEDEEKMNDDWIFAGTFVCSDEFFIARSTNGQKSTCPQKISASSMEVIGELESVTGQIATSPKSPHMLVTADIGKFINVYSVEDFRLLATYTTSEDCSGDIDDIKLSPDGSLCVIRKYKKGGLVVLDIRDVSAIFESARAGEEDGPFEAMDIHRDNERLVTFGDTIKIWSATTGELLNDFDVFDEFGVDLKFLYDPDRVLYVDDDRVKIMDMNGTALLTLNSAINPIFCLINPIRGGQEVITAEIDDSIRFHDTHTGEVLYTFVEHRSTKFMHFIVTEDANTIVGFNRNGLSYVLKNSTDHF